MTFYNKMTATFDQTDDYGFGDLEPEADMKWAAGKETFVWLINDHEKTRDPTPFMFYWTGFKELDLPPLPIWFTPGDSGKLMEDCSFAIGDQYAHKDTSIGKCVVDDEEVPTHPSLIWNNGNVANFTKVETFDAGELEPNAVNKWTNEDKSVYVWQVAEEMA